MAERKVHKLESDGPERHDAKWIACRDPERFQEPDGRKYTAELAWHRVTCKSCLRRKPKWMDR